MKPTVGYSGTALAKKLGIKEGSRVFVVDAPKDYAKLVQPLPRDVRLVPRVDAQTDMVHIFASERKRLRGALASALAKLQPAGTIWVSWPKKASKVPRTPSGSSRYRWAWWISRFARSTRSGRA